MKSSSRTSSVDMRDLAVPVRVSVLVVQMALADDLRKLQANVRDVLSDDCQHRLDAEINSNHSSAKLLFVELLP